MTRSQDHSQCSSHVIQGELLPKIDDDIDTVSGLTVFYQYVRTSALNQRQTQLVSVFTTELFAYYLKCLLAKQNSADDDFHHFIIHFPTKQLFIADVLAMKSRIHNFHSKSSTVHSSQQPTVSQPTLSATDLNTS